MRVTPEPRWNGPIPDWQGIPCRIGRLELWLLVQGNLPPRPFSLLALLPKRDAPQSLPYIHLGVQFLLEYRAQLTLDGSTGSPGTSTAQLVIP
jgi:hypothetical protein